MRGGHAAPHLHVSPHHESTNVLGDDRVALLITYELERKAGRITSNAGYPTRNRLLGGLRIGAPGRRKASISRPKTFATKILVTYVEQTDSSVIQPPVQQPSRNMSKPPVGPNRIFEP